MASVREQYMNEMSKVASESEHIKEENDALEQKVHSLTQDKDRL